MFLGFFPSGSGGGDLGFFAPGILNWWAPICPKMFSFLPRACPSAQPSNVVVWCWMVTVLSRFQSPKVRLVTSCGCLNLEIHCNIAEGLRWTEGRGKETERNWVLKTPFFSWVIFHLNLNYGKNSLKLRISFTASGCWLDDQGRYCWRYYSPPGCDRHQSQGCHCTISKWYQVSKAPLSGSVSGSSKPNDLD